MLAGVCLDEGDAAAEAKWIVSACLGLDLNNLYLHGFEVVEDRELEEIQAVVEKRKEGRPLAYILGEKYFYGRKFLVNPSVLIPRNETEMLCETAVSLIEKNELKSVLDLCTGSGCIAVTVALEAGLRVDASDISRDAIMTAEKNAVLNGADVHFIESDMFKDISGRYDLIISNPPYIPVEEYRALDREVLDYEPELALVGGEDGFDFYRIIAERAKEHLNNNGYLLMEIGYNQGNTLKEILCDTHYSEVEVIKDYQNLDRIVKAKYKG